MILKTNPCSFVLYKQCNSTWAEDPIGTSNTNICAAGCAMTSVSMVVSTFNDNSYEYNPPELNNYLNSHDGYYDEDLIVWDAVNPLGTQFINEGKIQSDILIKQITNCNNAFIANVMNGANWVLLTGYAGTNNFYVNDPGFNTASYPYSSMGNIVQYKKT